MPSARPPSSPAALRPTPSRRRLLLLLSLAVTACGGLPLAPSDGGTDASVPDASVPDASVPDASVPDASVPDASVPDGGSALLDWRDTRGAPLQYLVTGEYSGVPFALGDEQLALRGRCDGGACDYQWRAHDGGLVTAMVRNLAPRHTEVVSPDGRFASFLDVAERGVCADSLGFHHEWAHGTWTLLDLGTGTVLDRLPQQRLVDLSGPAFTRHGGLARLAPLLPGTCTWQEEAIRATTPPFGPPPAWTGLPAGRFVEAELPDGRLLVAWNPESLAVVHPTQPGTPELISTEATTPFQSGDFVHAFARGLVERVHSYRLSTRRLQTVSLPTHQDTFGAEGVSHRYAVACASERDGLRRCLVLDGQGEFPTADLRAARGAGVPGLALAGRQDFVVFIDGAGAVVRYDLRTGLREVLPLPAGRIRAVGDGGAVLLNTTERAWAIERNRVVPFEGRVVALQSTGFRRDGFVLPQSQVLFVIAVTPTGARSLLTAWHVASGRLVRLTDDLLYNPPFNAPFTAAADCAAPGFARTAGDPVDSASQETTWLHFTEAVPGPSPLVRQFVMPVDLSAPPRLVAELPPDLCAPPLASRSGRTLWLPVPMAGGRVRAVLATP